MTVDLEDEDGLHLDLDVLVAHGPLSLRGNRNGWRLEWAGWGILQESADVTGPFQGVETATSPWIPETDASRRFHRLLRGHATGGAPGFQTAGITWFSDQRSHSTLGGPF